jgi:hypothetical protein
LAAFSLAKLPKPLRVTVYKEMITACLQVSNETDVRLGLQELAAVYRGRELSEHVQVPKGENSIEFGEFLLLAEIRELSKKEQMYGYFLSVPSTEYSKLQMEEVWQYSLRILTNMMNQGVSPATRMEAFLILAELMKKPGNTHVQQMVLDHFRPAVTNGMSTKELNIVRGYPKGTAPPEMLEIIEHALKLKSNKATAVPSPVTQTTPPDRA